MSCFPFKMFSRRRHPSETSVYYERDRWDDEYCNSSSVQGLGDVNFREYVDSKDLVLVMFYHPRYFKTDSAKDEFVKTAESSQRHSFAAVNCLYEPEVCSEEGLGNLPYFKLYSRGRVLGVQADPSSLLHTDIKRWMKSFNI